MNPWPKRILYFLLCLIVLTGIAGSVFGAVYTPSGFKAKSALTDDQVLWCESGSTNGASKEACAKQSLIPWYYSQDYSWILTDTGWYPWRDITDAPTAPLPPTYAYVAPPCYPSVSELRWRWEGSRVYLLWYCDTPAAIWKSSRAYDMSKVLRPVSPSILGSMSKDDIAKADRLSATRAQTPDEEAAIAALEAAEGITITVATNGTTLTRPVYAATATNTKGATLTERAEVGKPCGRRRLTGTSYFQYGSGFTLCKVSGAISK